MTACFPDVYIIAINSNADIFIALKLVLLFTNSENLTSLLKFITG